MKKAAARKMPFTATPISLFGEAACAAADEIGVDVESYSLKGGRAMSTVDARTFLAKGTAQGSDFSSAVWLIVGYTL